MNRTVVLGAIVLLAAVAVASLAVADADRVARNGEPQRPTVPKERVYEVPPNARVTPIVGPRYCNESDCEDDRDRRCSDRGHGGASDHVFHISPEGTGNCLITCDDGYLLLVVEEHCLSTEGRPTPVRPRRQREVWFAPDGRPCVDPHAIATEVAVCATDD